MKMASVSFRPGTDKIWTVVRFPNGSWSYGGRPDSPDYELCEVWQISAESAKGAVRKAQARRSRENRKQASAGEPRQTASWPRSR